MGKVYPDSELWKGNRNGWWLVYLKLASELCTIQEEGWWPVDANLNQMQKRIGVGWGGSFGEGSLSAPYNENTF